MSSVGLLYVGAVLFMNGLMLIGLVPGKSAAILNFFVGVMQVVFPTIILIQSNNDLAIIFGAAGLYLFGFTYLYVGIIQMTGISGEGLGWFSVFVAACAVVIGILQFTLVGDPVFGVIWLTWAVLWFLFFLLLGLGRDSLTFTTGWFTIFVAHITGTIPAFFLLTGRYETNDGYAVLVAIAAAAALGAAFFLGRRGIPRGKASQENQAVAPA
ncbi:MULTISPECIES: AmiS/UreI family transporter [unclassified Arthrobacter]|uniref:AmiS/UreI family transporter n=1 Tax=unclassified Arthrobacter TaxID=235627 RepID=UPI0002E0BE3D|nr:MULTISPECIES: AmiS/UreI family transporter [unclassified Arthrobacter]PVE15242.1 transporter [Arthrobacter sp. Bz4]